MQLHTPCHLDSEYHFHYHEKVNAIIIERFSSWNYSLLKIFSLYFVHEVYLNSRVFVCEVSLSLSLYVKCLCLCLCMWSVIIPVSVDMKELSRFINLDRSHYIGFGNTTKIMIFFQTFLGLYLCLKKCMVHAHVSLCSRQYDLLSFSKKAKTRL